jgi:hypothetical protein
MECKRTTLMSIAWDLSRGLECAPTRSAYRIADELNITRMSTPREAGARAAEGKPAMRGAGRSARVWVNVLVGLVSAVCVARFAAGVPIPACPNQTPGLKAKTAPGATQINLGTMKPALPTTLLEPHSGGSRQLSRCGLWRVCVPAFGCHG